MSRTPRPSSRCSTRWEARRPRFAHEALLVGNEGKLSKRLGSLGVDHFRETGIEPQALVALLARIGTSDPVEPFADPAPLIATFDFARFGRAPARFDEAELAQLNARDRPPARISGASPRGLPDGMTSDAWEAIRPNLSTVAEAADWWRWSRGRSIGRAVERGPRLSDPGGGHRRRDRLVGRSLARAHRRAQGSDRPQGQARCSCRCDSRSPAASMAPTWPLCCPLIGKDRALSRLQRPDRQPIYLRV